MPSITYRCEHCKKQVEFGKAHDCQAYKKIEEIQVDTRCFICRRSGQDTTTNLTEIDSPFTNCLCNYCYETNTKELKL